MRGLIILAVAPVLILSACKPKLDPNQFTAKEIIEIFSAGGIWCFAYNKKDHSCALIQSLNRLTKEGLILDTIEGTPYETKIKYTIAYEVEGEKLCSYSSKFNINSINGYKTTDNNGEISNSDTIYSSEIIEKARENIKKSLTADAEKNCNEYFKSDNPSDGVKVGIRIVDYKDDVKQPIDEELQGSFWEKDVVLNFRQEK